MYSNQYLSLLNHCISYHSVRVFSIRAGDVCCAKSSSMSRASHTVRCGTDPCQPLWGNYAVPFSLFSSIRDRRLTLSYKQACEKPPSPLPIIHINQQRTNYANPYTTGKKTTLTDRYGLANRLQRRWGFALKWRTRIKWADWIWHLINSAIIKGEKEHWLNVRAEKYSGWSSWVFNELWDGTIKGRFIARRFYLFSLTGIYTHTGIILKHWNIY